MFLGVAAALIVMPGPDTAVVTKNALMHGRRAGIATSLGVNAGLLAWTLATALGVASLLRASAVAFTTLKLLGAVYLLWLGIRRCAAARRAAPASRGLSRGCPAGACSARAAAFAGDAHRPCNPSRRLLHEPASAIVDPASVLLPFLALGAIFVAMNRSGCAAAACWQPVPRRR